MANRADMTLRASFHHIGLAFAHPTDPWPLLAGSLGGRFIDGGSGPGYGWTQLAFANGFRVEGIHPQDGSDGLDPTEQPDLQEAETPDGTNFVRTFLAQYGAGPHHLTFSVNKLDLAEDRLRSAGVDLKRMDHTSPLEWSELLITPRDGHGVVIQLLGDLDAVPPAPAEIPEGFPERAIDAPVASLGRVVHAVSDLQGALSLFRDGLGGEIVSTGCAVDGNHWAELSWSGPGRLRLLEGTHGEIAKWVGHRRGRIRHLFFNFDEPEYIPGAEMVSPGRWVVGKDNILGTRLVFSSSARLAIEED